MVQILKSSRGAAQFLILVTGALLISEGAPLVAAQTLEEALAAYHQSDYPTALRGFRVHAEQGNARAQFYLGYMHYHSQGVRSTWSEGAPWYRRAAEQGHPCAQLELGLMYEMGVGVQRNGSQAARWYLLAAEAGVADAQTRLASVFYDGRIVPRDYGETVRWYRAAAKQDDTHALGMLGNMYRYGKGVRQDLVEAVKWYGLGAELGDSYTQYQLGSLYGSGIGVRKDLVQAHKWYNLAASQTSSDGIAAALSASHRDGVEKLLTTVELAEAQRLAREWHPRTPIAQQRCKLGKLVRDRSDTTRVVQPSTGSSPKRAATDEENAGSRVANVQRALLRSGYDPGPIDGILGIRTRLAIRSFQADHGLQVTGRLSEQLESAVLRAIMSMSPRAPVAGTAKEVFAGVSHSVVVVVAMDAGGVRTSQGSGVVVGRNEVVTNCHVVSGAHEIMIHRSAGPRERKDRQMAAKPIARNEDRDLCLLFVNRLSEPPATKPIPLGKTLDVSIGDEVYAIGAPRGLELSLSRGVVSQLRGNHDKTSTPLIQTDAAVSPGSSGGGLFNGAGKLIGITSFKLSGEGSEGIAFAMPAEWVEELVASAQNQIAARQQRLICFSQPTPDCLFGMAREMADAIDSAHKRTLALRTIAKAQADAGHRSKASETFSAAVQAADRISNAGGSFGSGRAEALAYVAEAQAEAGHEAEAIATIVKAIRTTNQINPAIARAKSLLEISRVLKRADLGVSARAVFAHANANAIHAANRIANENSRALALSHIVEALADVGDFKGAHQTATLIRDASWRAVLLRTIAKSLSRAGDEAGARAAWSNVIDTIEYIVDERKRAMSLAYTVEAQAEVDEVDKAKLTARKIDDANTVAVTLALKVIVRALTATGNISEARSTVASHDSDAVPDSAWGDIAVAQANAGDIYGSVQTVGQVDDVGERDRVSFALARAWATMGDVTQALHVASQIVDLDWRVSTLRAIAAVRAMAGDRPGARETFSNAVRLANKIDERFQRNSTLLGVATAQAKAEDVSGALQTAAHIDKGITQAEALRAIAVAQAEAGNPTGALQTFRRIYDVPVDTLRLVPVGSVNTSILSVVMDHTSIHAEGLASIAVRIVTARIPER